jgi:hypothetical protein
VALRAEEILQIKYELGVSVNLIGAEPYITYVAIFDKAIAPYIIDPTTTSVTPVTAAPTGAAIALTLAAVPVIAGSTTPAFTVGTSVNVDVGPNAETAQIQVLSGLTMWVTLFNAHGTNGAYPITMSGGENVVRSILQRINAITAELTNIAPTTAGVEQVNKIKLYASSRHRQGSREKWESLVAQREQARDDLGEAVGFTNLRKKRRSAGGRMELF